MTFQVKITAPAEQDLRAIYDYIAEDLQSPQIADGWLDRLEKSILSLDRMPERFRQYEKEPWKSHGLRVMPFENYLVFYIPKPEEQTVYIIRVMYGGRDIDSQLKQTK